MRQMLQKQELLKFTQVVRTQFFLGPAMDNIQKSAIKKLVVLDTIYLPEERLIDKIEQISSLIS